MDELEKRERPDRFSLKTWKRLLPYFARVKRHMALALVFMFLSAVIESTYPLFISSAVDKFITPGKSGGIALFAALFAAAVLLEGITVVFFSRQSIRVEMFTGRDLKRDCFVKLQQLDISFYNKSSVGYLLARVMSDTDRIGGMVSWGFSHLAWNVCYVLGSIAFMFTLDTSLALVLVALIPVVVLIAGVFQRKLLLAGRRIRAVNAEIIGKFNEGITGAKVSKTLVIEDSNVEEFKQVTDEMYRASIRSAMLNAVMLPLVLLSGSVALGAVLYRGGVLTMSDLLDYGVLAAFISYAVAIIEPVVHTAGVFNDMVAAQVAIERVMALLDEPVKIVDPPEVVEKYGDVFNPKKENWEIVRGEIEFKNVWFKYPEGGDYVLEDFSLKIPAGTTVALVGETGAGKSTIVSLVCRFYEPTKGAVLIDGRDCRERSQLWLHSSLGYVLQDSHLFSGTLMDNIRYGRLDATDEEVVAAARLVRADAVAARLPEGYMTEVGEGGSRLSAGEKQLVAFARAVLANPPILILDEATSNIDTETENLIQDAIAFLLKGRTSLIVAHRLSTVRRADMILVVDGGRIVERGTHSELIGKNGRYASLCRAMQIEENR